MDDALTRRIDALLPQTQCRRCGYADCHAYAAAVAGGAAGCNRCPPGGQATLAALAALLDRPLVALAPECGDERPPQVAAIDEARCIGCTLCIQACPIDAIIGAQGRMHAVLPSLCSGCELCVAPCPVDCIALLPVARGWTDADAQAARSRHVARTVREQAGAAARRGGRRAAPRSTPAERQQAIAAALVRARARRAAGSDDETP